MKILILYRYTPNWSYNHFCNTDFYQYLNKFDNVEAKFYGVDVDKIYPKLTVCKFNSNYKLAFIHNFFEFDMIIMAGRNRSFYEPQEKSGSWLPKDFQYIKCPKILIEPDFHKHRKSLWIKEMNFDLILHRHQSNVIRAEEDFPELKHVWFPFSVDNKIFNSKNFPRINKVSFVGTFNSKSYYFRKTASDKLLEMNLLDFQGLQYEDDYIKALHQYTIYLNGSSLFSIDCAKAFEIIASGGILLTNDCYNGFSTLFNDYFVTYKNDFSDLNEKVNNILSDEKYQKYLRHKGQIIIKNKHTHQKRCKELLALIKPLKQNNETYISTEKVDIVYVIGDLSKEAWKRFKNSYNSLKKNTNFNVKIIEVGKESHKEKIKKFINVFDYYFKQCESFDASIAKNIAFKHLIKENLFVFMDIDMIVPENFCIKVLKAYNDTHLPFICSYGRLKENKKVSYKYLINNFNQITEKYITDSGTLVCDKNTYELLNGFDEEYKNWGGRDSDFYKRAEIIKRFWKNKNIILFHQYHPRQFGEHKKENKQRYHQRLDICSRQPNQVSKIKGLQDLRNTTKKVIVSNKPNINRSITKLINLGFDVCFLKETCRDYMTHKKLQSPYHLSVTDLEKAKLLNLPGVILYHHPRKTKELKWRENKIKVPFPVISYLIQLYGKKIREQL